jgi:hypothetical protein
VLDEMASLLSENAWNADMMDSIAELLRNTGRTVSDYRP